MNDGATMLLGCWLDECPVAWRNFIDAGELDGPWSDDASRRKHNTIRLRKCKGTKTKLTVTFATGEDLTLFILQWSN